MNPSDGNSAPPGVPGPIDLSYPGLSGPKKAGGSAAPNGPVGSQGQPAGQGQAQGGAGEGGPSGPGIKLPGFGSEPPKKATPVSPLSKLVGNKDFIITIECYNDHVTVTPSGLQYRWNAGNAAANDQALVQTVTNLIARRQASVRQSEPPYRPVLRFRVAQDGYATFFRAYPLLEPLHLAWTKENVQD
jgi:hypothetical protein